MNMSYLWTSEYVSPGHPDKIADQISDAILDAYLRVDEEAKVAAETMVKGNTIYVCGEITTASEIPQSDLEKEIRKTVCDIGYDRDEFGFNGQTCEIIFNVSEQSREINKGVVQEGDIIGAGDQASCLDMQPKKHQHQCHLRSIWQSSSYIWHMVPAILFLLVEIISDQI